MKDLKWDKSGTKLAAIFNSKRCHGNRDWLLTHG